MSVVHEHEWARRRAYWREAAEREPARLTGEHLKPVRTLWAKDEYLGGRPPRPARGRADWSVATHPPAPPEGM